MPATIMLTDAMYYLRDENIASESITPGHLLDFVPSGGDEGQLRKNATAADAVAQPLWAIENELIGDDIDHAYLDGETARYVRPIPGAKIYAWLEDTANVAQGAALESNGAGELQARTTGAVVAWADEAVDNSVGGAAARIRVRSA